VFDFVLSLWMWMTGIAGEGCVWFATSVSGYGFEM